MHDFARDTFEKDVEILNEEDKVEGPIAPNPEPKQQSLEPQTKRRKA